MMPLLQALTHVLGRRAVALSPKEIGFDLLWERQEFFADHVQRAHFGGCVTADEAKTLIVAIDELRVSLQDSFARLRDNADVADAAEKAKIRLDETCETSEKVLVEAEEALTPAARLGFIVDNLRVMFDNLETDHQIDEDSRILLLDRTRQFHDAFQRASSTFGLELDPTIRVKHLNHLVNDTYSRMIQVYRDIISMAEV